MESVTNLRQYKGSLGATVSLGEGAWGSARVEVRLSETDPDLAPYLASIRAVFLARAKAVTDDARHREDARQIEALKAVNEAAEKAARVAKAEALTARRDLENARQNAARQAALDEDAERAAQASEARSL